MPEEIYHLPIACKNAELGVDNEKETVLKKLVTGVNLSRHDFNYEKERSTLSTGVLLYIVKILLYYNSSNLSKYTLSIQEEEFGKIKKKYPPYYIKISEKKF